MQITNIFSVINKYWAYILKHFFKPVLVLWCLAVLHTDGLAQKQNDFKRFGNWIKDDPVAMFKDAGLKQIVGIGTAGISIAYLSVFDESTSSGFQHHYGDSRVLGIANAFGSKRLALPASVALFGSSLLTNNTKFQDAAFTSLQSILMTSLTVGAGKFLFARERPYQNDGAYDFDFVSMGQTSFPSGHTARAFSFVTPWVMYYPGPLTYALFALPAGTAIARIAEGKHWLSDVAAGAAIGFSMGYYLSKRHLGTQDIQVTPSFGKNMAALSINFEF